MGAWRYRAAERGLLPEPGAGGLSLTACSDRIPTPPNCKAAWRVDAQCHMKVWRVLGAVPRLRRWAPDGLCANSRARTATRPTGEIPKSAKPKPASAQLGRFGSFQAEGEGQSQSKQEAGPQGAREGQEFACFPGVASPIFGPKVSCRTKRRELLSTGDLN
ncbi:hypothetical protein H920_10377 [Fukomys damarensis]|uniref:Uncharacterized protein n=1 Tax=Fukomys damarensis TaxID=885580 RepID=A0A091DDC0_FUKDA|nr:hypothetical protein H920_10377 [Fukomys damarensis]